MQLMLHANNALGSGSHKAPAVYCMAVCCQLPLHLDPPRHYWEEATLVFMG